MLRKTLLAARKLARKLFCFVLAASVAVAAPRFIGIGTSTQQDAKPLLLRPLSWAYCPAFLTNIEDNFKSTSPTCNLDAVGLARYYGYEIESHHVTTEDGYILTLHRLPGGKLGDSANNPKPAVVVYHGYLVSSRDFMVLGPKKSLGIVMHYIIQNVNFNIAFFLVDAGYDVWLPNLRGNTYSRNHTTLSPETPEFWDFSYTEYGMYDVPAALNYVSTVTNRSKVHYIGHSTGTVVFFIMGSKKPGALNKVQSFTALAPITSIRKCRSALLRLLLRSRWPVIAAEKVGLNEFVPNYRWLAVLAQAICQDGWITQKLCTGVLFELGGYNIAALNTTILPEIMTHAPAGSSLKTFDHFGQNFRTGFREYDYGPEVNLQKYNSREAPYFDLTGIDVPTQIFYGLNDLMGDYTTARETCKTLPNVFRCHEVEDENFNHIDFMWAKTAHTLVYPTLLQGLRRYDSPTA